MKLAIMQPYLFPYLGYFHLVNAVDKFVFYDDVNFIKRGWINRNLIIAKSDKKYFTLNLKESSQNKKINGISVGQNGEIILKTIYHTYSKTPFFKDVFPIIEECLRNSEDKTISFVAANSVKAVSAYLGMKTIFENSSECYLETKEFGKVERLISICKKNNASQYYNMEGGRDLYAKEDFNRHNIELIFLNPELQKYRQFSNEFISGLSIIDVLMFNSQDELLTMFNKIKDIS